MKNLVKKHNPSCVFLIEYKCEESRLQKVCRKLGYCFSIIINPISIAGGWLYFGMILLIWKSYGILEELSMIKFWELMVVANGVCMHTT